MIRVYLPSSEPLPVCSNKLKPCRSRNSTSSITKLQTQSQPPLMEEGQIQDELQREDVSEEELLTAQCVSVNLLEAAEFNQRVETEIGLDLSRKTPAGGAASRLQQSYRRSSNNSSDHRPFNSTSAFCNTRLEFSQQWYPTTTTDSQQTAAHERPRSSSCLEKMEQTERQELEGGEGRTEEDLDLKNELQSSEGSESEDEELNRNKKISYIYHQPQPGSPPAFHNLYMCIPCAKGFPTSEQLVAHVESHTAQELSVKAEDAEERSFTEGEDQGSDNLPTQSTKEEPQPDVARHVCSVCRKSYVDVVLLRQHERSHWPTRPFSCHICGRLFTQRGTMTRHIRGHFGLKPFACEECGMRFTRQYRKMEHMKIHLRETPYECQLCGVKFTEQRSIVSHLKMHTVVS